MNIKELLPVGSVVLLKDAVKKIVIIGIMPAKTEESGKMTVYDYVGVPYPEGFIGEDSLLLFMHERIHEICFEGYQNEERMLLMEVIQKITNKTKAVLEEETKK